MRRTSLLVATLVALSLGCSDLASVAAADEPPGGTLRGPTVPTRTAPAMLALQQAERLFDGVPGNHRVSGDAADGARDATLVLRDLAVRVDQLSGAQKRRAQAILARPSEGVNDPDLHGYTVPEEHKCTQHFCMHWVSSTADAPAAADANKDGVPDWVKTNADVFENVWRRIVSDGDPRTRDLGYRAPKSDLSSPEHGPDGKLDIYLADIGGDGLYGYCTSDDPNLGPHRWDVSAFCVVDNDFARSQFGGAKPQNSLRVTAAHEFFHAVQYSYDSGEDRWFMEGTAVWMEDQIYDNINDNLQYLTESALANPSVPVDDGDPTHLYGSWVFWRFLTERLGSSVVRRVWQRADAASGGANEYSMQALRNVTHAMGRRFVRTFADFGAANQISHRWYHEGASYPQAPAAATVTLSPSTLVSRRVQARINHLTNVSVVARAASLVGHWRLRVTLDMSDPTLGSAATVLVHRTHGKPVWHRLRLGPRGNAVLTVPFSPSAVSSVAVTMTNASTRYTCRQGTVMSCQGRPKDNGLKSSVGFRAIR